MPEQLPPPGFLVIDGPVGIAKTRPAERQAAHFGSDSLLEGAEENPFSQCFYDNPRESAFPAQLF